jgi:xanthine/uracil/vitamin C permease (AzgA family)
MVGGKSWKTGVIAGGLFLVSPLVPAVGHILGLGYQVGPDQWLHPLIAPLLIIGGVTCLSGLYKVNWSQPEECYPVGIMCIITLLSNSIINGFASGLVTYVAIRTAQGHIKSLHPFYYLIIPLLMLRYLVI